MGTPEISIGQAIENGVQWLSNLDKGILRLMNQSGSLEKKREYQEASTNAWTCLNKANIMKNDRNGGPLAEKALAEAEKSYHQCVNIRVLLLDDILKHESEMQHQTLRKQYESVLGSAEAQGMSAAKPALANIERYIKKLEVSAAEALDDNKSRKESFYRTNADHTLSIKTGDVRAAKYEIEQTMKNIGNAVPGLSALLNRLNQVLSFLEDTDPAGPALAVLNQLGKNIEMMRGPFDWRALKVTGIALTGMITTIGVGLITKRAFKGEGLTMDIGTGLWGMGFLALLYPNALRGSVAASQAAIATADAFSNKAMLKDGQIFAINNQAAIRAADIYSNKDDLKEAGKIGAGPLALKVFETFQDLRKDKEFMKLVQTGKGMSMADLGVYVQDNAILNLFEAKFRTDDYASGDVYRMAAIRVLTTKLPDKQTRESVEAIIAGKPLPPDAKV